MKFTKAFLRRVFSFPATNALSSRLKILFFYWFRRLTRKHVRDAQMAAASLFASFKQQFRQSLHLRKFFSAARKLVRENFYPYQCFFEMSTWYNNLGYLRPKVQNRCCANMLVEVIWEISLCLVRREEVLEENWWSLLNYIGNFTHVHQLNLHSIYCVVGGKTITTLTLLVHVVSLYDIKCNLSSKICRNDNNVGLEKEKVFFVKAENFNAEWKHSVRKVLLGNGFLRFELNQRRRRRFHTIRSMHFCIINVYVAMCMEIFSLNN